MNETNEPNNYCNNVSTKKEKEKERKEEKKKTNKHRLVTGRGGRGCIRGHTVEKEPMDGLTRGLRSRVGGDGSPV